MQQDFLVESRSYDKILRGSWRTYQLSDALLLGDETSASLAGCLRLWLPAGTPMNWSTGTRPLKNHCLQFFWPQRWYMLSAFYRDRELMHTYANVIQPVTIGFERLSYVDLDLSVLVKPDLTYEVLTQAEFDHMASMLHYDEDTRISSLMALRSLTSTIQLSAGIFSVVPYQLKSTDFHLPRSGTHC